MQIGQLISTVTQRCRVCYTCVRECPAKAIRIVEGQAQVLQERCIGCGNCVRVCSQKAKQVLDGTPLVRELLADGQPTVAILAPSFPVEFVECGWREVVGMLRALGFTGVYEVGFGADLVAREYNRLMEKSDGTRWIATTCPAVVGYVERYHPELVPRLAPVVSPMIATARALRRLVGPDILIVFIGPCVAKKAEIVDRHVAGEVDAVLTFTELRSLLSQEGITHANVRPAELDGPPAGRGALFPISRGLLQAADIRDDILDGEVVAADGHADFLESLEDAANGDLRVRLLEVLACKGCVSGPGMRHDEALFSRRRRVRTFVHERLADLDQKDWNEAMDALSDLDLSRGFTSRDARLETPREEDITQKLRELGKWSLEDELNCGACGYESCREHAIAILVGLAETEMCLPNTIDRLHATVGELAESHRRLASTQEALMHSEKLASMGQLAAGIAHEVNNPLGVVLMYAHLLLEERGSDPRVKEDLELIAREADRCKKIVSGLLNFARQAKVLRQLVSIPELAEKTCRALPAPPGITVHFEQTTPDPMAEVDADQIAQVLTNLITNAYGAMPEGGEMTVRTAGDERSIQLSVIDTGVGIPPENLDKVFEPFFTTKQMGKGTGLGLAVVYGIVKMHNGDIQVWSQADPTVGPTGTTFTVRLPRKVPENGARIE
ncbi:MAG TPA: [Fe-Fe] hydrogenase large subunit C-terminal domain-containing protein [Longimicrobiales bacterium]|nr:[Fe-Fe] hydrogenase large subunit C-terminal domain-containing protein [Longimicrobiales bacterium]